MLLRLAYLTATNTFALLRLLPMSDRDKDIEILMVLKDAPSTPCWPPPDSTSSPPASRHPE
ncbi:hypothetical protein ACWGCW_29630 [Streptomyces sp. NPDC054933]